MRVLISILLGLALGAVVGYTLAPRMHAPHVAKDALLRQRALDYYAASRRLDRWTMVRIFTPARQLDQADKLRKEAEAAAKAAADRPGSEQKEAEQTAAGIKPENFEIHQEGDWATTQGKYDLIVEGQRIPSQLERVAWVYNKGQWWQYNFELVERNSYGHPPDFAMDLDPWK